MAIYEMLDGELKQISETTFNAEGIRERDDLQRLLREQIDIISADTLVIAEEFGEWEDSRRRIDLLGLDKDANLVVIELKRTEDGGHMELQAVRYAAMVSTLTFDRAVDVYARYLDKQGSDLDARESILQFLDWEEPDDELFAQDVNIVLASAEFSKELTSAVMWLNERSLNIRCIRLKPYILDGRVLLDVQQIIPLPEAEEYQVRVREKDRKERAARREFNPNFTKIRLQLGDDIDSEFNKRNTMYTAVCFLVDAGADIDTVRACLTRPSKMEDVEGVHEWKGFVATANTQRTAKNKKPLQERRYFNKPGQLFHADERTFALSNQWTTDGVLDCLKAMAEAFPEYEISFEMAGPCSFAERRIAK